MHHHHHSSSSSSPPDPKISTTMSITPMGLARYGSAPGSFLSSLVSDHHHHRPSASTTHNTAETDTNITQDFNFLGRSRFFSPVGDSPCLTSESSCKLDSTDLNKSVGLEMGLDRSYVINDVRVGGDLSMRSRGGGREADGVVVGGGGGGGGSSSPLFRHSSSPAGILSNLMVDNGFSVTRGGAGYSSQSPSDAMHVMANRRLKTQLSFSSRQDSLSHLSEISSDDAAAGNNIGQYMASNFQIGSWEDTNQIAFSGPVGKRGKDNNGDIIAALSGIDPSAYSLSKTSLDMANVENLFQIQQDSVPCKIRAKRGCATHPRSIAERERRTRISEKLRKLQELVPNMDKQTSTADMLDLAVQHIKGLQTHIQNLNQESASCTCSSKQEIQ